ncbi:MAG TPA: hemolysin III family protein [Nitrospirota bacterium]|nr:hemolysin III family protein [Nitrospirota bacterium]
MYRGERINSITHLVGACLSLAGLVVLVVFAGRQGDPWKIVSFSIYGVTLFALYLFSTLYHSVRGASKKVFQKIDHSAIYLLIAGSYTPFALVTLRGAWGWSIFGVIWGLALFGIIQDTVLAQGRRILSVVIYLLMGWLALAAIRPLTRALPGAGMVWLVAGGVFYTIGVLFYALDKKVSFGHEIFHLFVLAGSACHYFTILLYVV